MRLVIGFGYTRFMDTLSAYNIPDPNGELLDWLEHPTKEDIIIRTVFQNVFVSGFLVAAGTNTRETYPDANDLPVHFLKKVKCGERAYFPNREFDITKEVSECLPGLCPRPLGFSKTRDIAFFRSEYILGQTVRSKCSPYGFLRTLPEQALPKLDAGREDLSAMWAYAQASLASALSLHDLGVIHGDLHMENIILDPTAGFATLIDLETSQAPRDETFFDLDLGNIKAFGRRVQTAAHAQGIGLDDCALSALIAGAKHDDPVISESPRRLVSEQLSLD